MTFVRASAGVVLCAGLVAGTIIDRPVSLGNAGRNILVGDLHVHGGLPLDATLPPWELQREAGRRGLDVIAIVGHNQTVVAWLEGLLSSGDVIVLPGLEVGNAGLHLVAAGVRETIDWRLAAHEAVEAAQRQGGVAIAAHPVRGSWLTRNERAVAELDGVETAHPLVYFEPEGQRDLAQFYERARSVNPDVAAIGSSDYHGLGDMGACRTYLFVNERSERGVLDAIRGGRTVASDGRGNLTGPAELVAAVQNHLASHPTPQGPSRVSKLIAHAVVFALAAVVIFR